METSVVSSVAVDRSLHSPILSTPSANSSARERMEPALRARPHFYLVGETERSLNSPAPAPARTSIRINGKWHALRGRSATFAQILRLAYPDLTVGNPAAATVSFRGGPARRPSGVMTPGDVIEIADGLVVNADATYAS